MTGRPEDGYRVAARIESRSGRRGHLLAILAAAVVVAWGAAVVGDRLRHASPTGSAPGHSAVAAATLRPPAVDGRSGPTFPPDIEIRQDVPLGRIPLVLGSLAWIDPIRGTVQRPQAADLRQFRFVMPDGGVACVCLEAGTGGAGPALRLDRYDRIGQLTSVRTVDDWLPNGLVTGLADAVLVPDGSAAVVASFVAVAGGWDLRVQRIPFDGTVALVERAAPVDLAATAEPARLEVRAALAPDGARFRVSVLQEADDAAGVPNLEQDWEATWDGAAWTAIRVLPPIDPGAQPATCQVRAWATATVFFEACLATKVQDDGSQELFARIDDGTGVVDDIGLGFVPFLDPVGWVVDGTHGVVYGWTAMTHQLYRIQLPSGKLTLRVMGVGTLGGHADLGDVPPEASPPAGGGRGVGWQPTGTASEPQSSPLVGSTDGSLLYATGLAADTGASTGIWVFDAGSLALVAHWAAAAAYDDIALTPNGRYLVAMGGPDADELGRFGNHGPELVVHDPVDGSIVVVLRSLVAAYGGIPGLLPAGPPSG